MLYNKNCLNKINDKKLLHKVKKSWVVISVATLGILSGTVIAHADTNSSNQQPSRDNSQFSQNLDSQNKSIKGFQSLHVNSNQQIMPNSTNLNSNRDINSQQVTRQANDLHDQILSRVIIHQPNVGQAHNLKIEPTSLIHNQSESVPTTNPINNPHIRIESWGNTGIQVKFISDGHHGKGTGDIAEVNPGQISDAFNDNNDSDSASFNTNAVSQKRNGYVVDRYAPALTLPFDVDSNNWILKVDQGVKLQTNGGISKGYQTPLNNEDPDNINYEDSSQPTNDFSYLFSSYANKMWNHFRKIDLTNLDTRNASSLSNLFKGDQSLQNVILSTDSNPHVSDVHAMFAEDPQLSHVAFNNFNMSNVSDMSSLFLNDPKLRSVNLSGLNTDNVTNMSSMFSGDSSLSDIQGLDQLNTTHVTNMRDLFNQDSSLKGLDVSKWQTNQVKNMIGMFTGDSSLRSLNLGDFNADGLSDTLQIRLHIPYPIFDQDDKLATITIGSKADLRPVIQLDSNYFQNLSSALDNNTNLIPSVINDHQILPAGTYYINATEPVTVDYIDEDTSKLLSRKQLTVNPNGDLLTQLKTFNELPSGYYMDPDHQSNVITTDKNGQKHLSINLLNDNVWTGYRWDSAHVKVDGNTDTITVSDGMVGFDSDSNADNDSIFDNMQKAINTHNPDDPEESHLNGILQVLPNRNQDWKIVVNNVMTDPLYTSSDEGLFRGDVANNSIPDQIVSIRLNNFNVNYFYSGNNFADKAYYFNNMFRSDYDLQTIDLGNINTDDVTKMSQMFKNDHGLQSINMQNMNTRKVSDMSGMFDGDLFLQKLSLGSDTQLNRNGQDWGSPFFNNNYNLNNKNSTTDIKMGRQPAGEYFGLGHLTSAQNSMVARDISQITNDVRIPALTENSNFDNSVNADSIIANDLDDDLHQSKPQHNVYSDFEIISEAASDANQKASVATSTSNSIASVKAVQYSAAQSADQKIEASITSSYVNAADQRITQSYQASVSSSVSIANKHRANSAARLADQKIEASIAESYADAADVRIVNYYQHSVLNSISAANRELADATARSADQSLDDSIADSYAQSANERIAQSYQTSVLNSVSTANQSRADAAASLADQRIKTSISQSANQKITDYYRTSVLNSVAVENRRLATLAAQSTDVQISESYQASMSNSKSIAKLTSISASRVATSESMARTASMIANQVQLGNRLMISSGSSSKFDHGTQINRASSAIVELTSNSTLSSGLRQISASNGSNRSSNVVASQSINNVNKPVKLHHHDKTLNLNHRNLISRNDSRKSNRVKSSIELDPINHNQAKHNYSYPVDMDLDPVMNSHVSDIHAGMNNRSVLSAFSSNMKMDSTIDDNLSSFNNDSRVNDSGQLPRTGEQSQSRIMALILIAISAELLMAGIIVGRRY